ncbi:MAG TPA: ScpA family protein [Acidimicrobiia bacterium]|nr:ScpA family protein [Acidimicrobiia bacterium]
MTFHVRTTVFEGPLDLLLQLITKHQVEITAVGLTEVVGEYLSFLDEMKEMDLDVTSEFLLIAATLVQLKAQSLLPSPSDFALDDELALAEERDRLLARLLASVTFKDVAAVLLRRLQDGNRYVPRISGLDQEIEMPAPEVEIPATPEDLTQLAAKVFSRAAAEPDLDHLDLDLPSVEAAISDLRARLRLETVASFEDLTEHCSRPVEVAAYFLALLEMARWGLIEVSQADWTAEIEVRHLDDGSIDLTSEWAS